jgi:hypothetical protein
LPSGGWKEFEEEQLLMCPPRVEGYALAKKRWVYLDVESIADMLEPEEKDSMSEAFNRMILPKTQYWEETKRLIELLVKSHASGTANATTAPIKRHVPSPLQDLVKGKGQGLVILLYGEST